MLGNDVPFFWVSLFAYLIATLLYALDAANPGRWSGKAAFVVLTAGFVSHTAALLVRGFATGHPPFVGMYEYASCLAWATVLFYLVLQLRHRAQSLGIFVSPVAFAVIGEGAFAVAFASSVMYLLKLRGADRLPSLETLDDLTYRAIVVGYPLFTLGALFAGAIWAWKAWGRPWGWDPKEVGSLVIWLIYSAYLHARVTAGWKGKRAAILSILGFAAAIFSFISNLFVGGLHTYG